MVSFALWKSFAPKKSWKVFSFAAVVKSRIERGSFGDNQIRILPATAATRTAIILKGEESEGRPPPSSARLWTSWTALSPTSRTWISTRRPITFAPEFPNAGIFLRRCLLAPWTIWCQNSQKCNSSATGVDFSSHCLLSAVIGFHIFQFQTSEVARGSISKVSN